MTAYAMPDIAAKLYGLSLAIEDPRAKDPMLLVRQGRLLLQAAQERRRAIPFGRDTAWTLDAAATFLRSCAKVDREHAVDLLNAAEALEYGRELTIWLGTPDPAPEAA